jgi:hypothetical protein
MSLAALTCLVACGGGGTEPSGSSWPEGFYLNVDPDAIILGIDSSFHLGAAVYTEDDIPNLDPPLIYSSSNSNVAAVNVAGTVLAVGAGTATITVRSKNLEFALPVSIVPSGIRLAHVPLSSWIAPPWSVAVHGDDVYVGTAGSGGGLYHGSLANRTVNATPILPATVNDMVIGLAGDTIWLANTPGATMGAFSLPSTASLGSTANLGGHVISLARWQNGNGFFIGTEPGNLVSVSGDSQVTATFSSSLGAVRSLAVSPQDDMLYAGIGASLLKLTLLNDTVIAASTILQVGEVRDLDIAPDGTALYVATGLETFDIVNLASNQTEEIPVMGLSESIQLLPDGHTVAITTLGFGGRVFLYDTLTREFTRAWSLGETLRDVTIAPNGIIIVVNETGWVDFLQ